ncbi:MAG TPA: hypothetical protein DDY72_02545 [Verrucomicrobia bacterium]|nr:hypothetical protein [Verrucomicrobiota bacterium]
MVIGKTTKFVLTALLFTAIGAVGALLCEDLFRRGAGEERAQAPRAEAKTGVDEARDKTVRKKTAGNKRARRRSSTGARQEALGETFEEDALSGMDKACYEGLQKAIDDENYALVASLLDGARRSSSKEVRAKAVEALSWFGRAALSDLTLFMADPDEDIRQDACTAWASALSEVEDAQEKGQYASAALEILQDKNLSDSLIMEINDLPDAQQIDIVTRLIEGPNKTAGEVAREHYEFITGEEYESPEAAEQWLQENPED